MSQTIPSEHLQVSNEVLSILPNKESTLCHYLSSSANEYGLQALIVFETGKAKLEKLLGSCENVQANTVFLQTCKPYAKFVPHDKAEFFCTISIDDYLSLYSFFLLKWPQVLSKITATINSMISGTDWIRITKTLRFRQNGSCSYTCNLGIDFSLAANASCKENGSGDYEIGVTIVKGKSNFELPLTTATKLFSDVEAYHLIYNHYKKSILC